MGKLSIREFATRFSQSWSQQNLSQQPYLFVTCCCGKFEIEFWLLASDVFEVFYHWKIGTSIFCCNFLLQPNFSTGLFCCQLKIEYCFYLFLYEWMRLGQGNGYGANSAITAQSTFTITIAQACRSTSNRKGHGDHEIFHTKITSAILIIDARSNL